MKYCVNSLDLFWARSYWFWPVS